MLFNSFSFAIFLPLAFGIYCLMTHTPQGYRGGVRPDSASAAFGAFDQLDSFGIPAATSLIFGLAAVAFCLNLSCWPCRGGEVGESAMGWLFSAEHGDSRKEARMLGPNVEAVSRE